MTRAHGTPIHALATLAVVVSTITAPAAQSPSQPPAASAGSTFPDTYFKAVPGLDRFRDPGYFRLLASDGIRSVDAKALFSRIGAAADAGEGYKALFLARLFTAAEPGNSVGWSNRARLAAALGFKEEATRSQANAGRPTPTPVAGGAVPGQFSVQPRTLADWAAAMAMAADDVAAREGRPVVLAVRDDLSGIAVASEEQIQIENRGPWATANPVQVEHVLPNMFVLTDATPMDHKSMKGGLFAAGALALAGSAYATKIGAADAAAELSSLYGNAMAKAFEVPSEFKGGAFVSTTYVDGIAKVVKATPKTSGKHEAVGTPLAMLWSSGGSLATTVQAAWKSGDSTKSEALKVDARTKKPEWKKHAVPALSYPRVQQLCFDRGRCSSPLTLLELLLNADDIRAFAPGVESSLPDVAPYHGAYAARQPISLAAAGGEFAGFDSAGTVYVTRHRPTEWLTGGAPSTKR